MNEPFRINSLLPVARRMLEVLNDIRLPEGDRPDPEALALAGHVCAAALAVAFEERAPAQVRLVEPLARALAATIRDELGLPGSFH